MQKREKDQERSWIPALMVTLLLGVGLHDLFRLWPSIVTEFLAPVNESLWEHVKLLFWPVLLVEIAYFSPSHRSGGLAALLLMCGILLLGGWVNHVLLGVGSLAADLLLYGGCVLGWFLLSEKLTLPRQWLPFLWGLILLLGALIVLFTLSPPHGTLFRDLRPVSAWIWKRCWR